MPEHHTHAMAERARGPSSNQAAEAVPGTFARFFRFCLVGCASLGVDYAVFIPLVHPDLMDPRAAAVFAYLAASVAGYGLNRRLTFSDRAGGPIARGFLVYVFVGLGGAGIRLAVLHALMTLAHWGRPPEVYLASGLGVVAGTLASYLGALRWVFPSSTSLRGAP